MADSKVEIPGNTPIILQWIIAHPGKLGSSSHPLPEKWIQKLTTIVKIETKKVICLYYLGSQLSKEQKLRMEALQDIHPRLRIIDFTSPQLMELWRKNDFQFNLHRITLNYEDNTRLSFLEFILQPEDRSHEWMSLKIDIMRLFILQEAGKALLRSGKVKPDEIGKELSVIYMDFDVSIFQKGQALKNSDGAYTSEIGTIKTKHGILIPMESDCPDNNCSDEEMKFRNMMQGLVLNSQESDAQTEILGDYFNLENGVIAIAAPEHSILKSSFLKLQKYLTGEKIYSNYFLKKYLDHADKCWRYYQKRSTRKNVQVEKRLSEETDLLQTEFENMMKTESGIMNACVIGHISLWRTWLQSYDKNNLVQDFPVFKPGEIPMMGIFLDTDAMLLNVNDRKLDLLDHHKELAYKALLDSILEYVTSRARAEFQSVKGVYSTYFDEHVRHDYAEKRKLWTFLEQHIGFGHALAEEKKVLQIWKGKSYEKSSCETCRSRN